MTPRQVLLRRPSDSAFLLIRYLGLTDSRLSLVLPTAASAFGTFLMRQYFLQMPPNSARPRAWTAPPNCRCSPASTPAWQ